MENSLQKRTVKKWSYIKIFLTLRKFSSFSIETVLKKHNLFSLILSVNVRFSLLFHFLTFRMICISVIVKD